MDLLTRTEIVFFLLPGWTHVCVCVIGHVGLDLLPCCINTTDWKPRGCDAGGGVVESVKPRIGLHTCGTFAYA